MGIQSKPGMKSEVRCNAPPADYRIRDSLGAAAKPAALAEGQIIGHVAIEKAGGVGDTPTVIAFRVVSVLEEEAEAGLAYTTGKRLFITKRPEVAQAVAHTLRPRVVGLEL